MKKFAILTSILALTACGGGSGGDRNRTTNYTDAVRQSNTQITGMVSNSKYQITRYVANKLGTDADSVNLSRGAFTPNAHSGNTDYDTALELIEIAGWLADENTTENDIVTMFNQSKTDKNKIKAALKLLDSMYCFVGGDAQETAERILAHRPDFQVPLKDLQQNTELFDMKDVEFVMAAASGGGGDEGGSKDILTFELDSHGQIIAINHSALVKNGSQLVRSDSESAIFSRNKDKHNNYTGNSFHVEQTNGEGTTFTGNGTVITYGQKMGLTYSDFGQFKYDLHWVNGAKSGDEKTYEPFAGGYKELRKEIPESAMTFTGKAVGCVSDGDFDKNISGDAALTFNNGQETLNMQFSGTKATEDDIPWYDVKITRNQTTNENSITFTTNDTLNQNIPTKLKLDDFNDNTKIKNNYLVDGYNGGEYPNNRPDKGKLDIGYYGGRDGNTIEAAGVTQYVESFNNGDREIRMNVGFGLKRD